MGSVEWEVSRAESGVCSGKARRQIALHLSDDFFLDTCCFIFLIGTAEAIDGEVVTPIVSDTLDETGAFVCGGELVGGDCGSLILGFDGLLRDTHGHIAEHVELVFGKIEGIGWCHDK